MSIELHYEAPRRLPNPAPVTHDYSTEAAALIVLLCSTTTLLALSCWIAIAG
jgi:hypothetical protein